MCYLQVIFQHRPKSSYFLHTSPPLFTLLTQILKYRAWHVKGKLVWPMQKVFQNIFLAKSKKSCLKIVTHRIILWNFSNVVFGYCRHSLTSLPYSVGFIFSLSLQHSLFHESPNGDILFSPLFLQIEIMYLIRYVSLYGDYWNWIISFRHLSISTHPLIRGRYLSSLPAIAGCSNSNA